MQVDSESDDTDVSFAALRNPEGESGHEEEQGHEGESREEQVATAAETMDLIAISDLAKSPILSSSARTNPKVSIVQTAGSAMIQLWQKFSSQLRGAAESTELRTYLSAPKPRVAPRAVISSKPA